MNIDISRLAVIIWLYLPALVFIAYRLWYTNRINKYPSTQIARVSNVSYSKGVLGGAGSADLTYVYRVMGADYESAAYLDGKQHKAGEEIPIRYNPSKPDQSIIWIPMKNKDWMLLGLMWLTLSLGDTIFFIFIGVLISGLLIFQFRKVRDALKASGIALGWIVFTIIVGLLMALGGIGMLFKSGFWNQNLLWELWNHQPLFSGLYSIGELSQPEVGVGKVIDPMIIIEAIAVFFLGVVGARLFSILRKKMNIWLAFVLVVIIFMAIVVAYAIVRTDYLEPLFSSRVNN